MVYRCIKEFYIDNINFGESPIESNAGFVGLDTLWKFVGSEYIVNKSNVKLYRIDDGKPFVWIEISNDRLSKNFEIEEV